MKNIEQLNYLIYFTNNSAPDSLLQAPGVSQVKSFKNKLVVRGISTTIRISKGDDISAACGQLKSLHLK